MKKEKIETNENRPIDTPSVETQDNILDFPSKLRALRKGLAPELIKQREAWKNGTARMVDYIEWHTVADILDETASNWAHSVKDIKQIGEIITVTVAITIDGVTREGIGTGATASESGIKKAEHDALKRAAVKFGIARELYKKEAVSSDFEPAYESADENIFPANPIAKSLGDLVTAKQLAMIRAIAREIEIDANVECEKYMSCSTDELSKKAASLLIDHLQDLRNNRHTDAQSPMRRAG